MIFEINKKLSELGIKVNSIEGIRVNAKHFVLDGEIKIIEKEKEKENE